ncbi:MAG: peptidogalycan biosysnthesis protein, partial [Cyanobacteria bacterium P01_H01_bin.58]
RRGFPARPNYSLHRFYANRLQKILVNYIDEINEAETREIEAINNDLPLKSLTSDVGATNAENAQ